MWARIVPRGIYIDLGCKKIIQFEGGVLIPYLYNPTTVFRDDLAALLEKHFGPEKLEELKERYPDEFERETVKSVQEAVDLCLREIEVRESTHSRLSNGSE